MGCNQSVPQKESIKVIEVKKVDETTKDETVSHKIAVIEEEACDFLSGMFGCCAEKKKIEEVKKVEVKKTTVGKAAPGKEEVKTVKVVKKEEKIGAA